MEPEEPGGGGGGGGGGSGDLFGDQYVLVRDLDPAADAYPDGEPGDGDGEPVFDANGNPILLGSDGLPIYYVADPAAEGDWILDPARAGLAQTVELGRANVARAPESVMQQALTEALAKLETAVDVDAAGRIVYDTGLVDENGVAVLATIDSPRENLALYEHLMKAGGESSWPEVKEFWPEKLKDLIANDPDFANWDPSSLLGAAFDKAFPITLDAFLTENTILGVNTVLTTTDNVGNPIVDYFEFNNETTETYNHNREEKYSDTFVTWLADLDGDGAYVYVDPVSVYEAVFGSLEWTDLNTSAGADDFAQAVDDSRAIISFMHDQLGAVEVGPPQPGVTLVGDQGGPAQDNLVGTPFDDTLNGLTLDDVLIGLAGNDLLDGGTGDDAMEGGEGDDTYHVDSSLDVASEFVNQGIDTVLASINNYILPANIEKLTLIAPIALWGEGNALDNALLGNALVNTLIGHDGNDILDGGTNAVATDGDFLLGGVGNDTYQVRNDFDVVDEGTTFPSTPGSPLDDDTIVSNINWFWDLRNVGEILQIAEGAPGSGFNDPGATIVGSMFDNEMIGNSGTNIMFGRGGSDTYRAGDGIDWISLSTLGLTDGNSYAGVDGFNTIIVEQRTTGPFSCDIIYEFDAGKDRIDVSAYDLGTFAAVQATGVNDGLGNSCYALGDGLDCVFLVGLTTADVTAANFII